MIHAVAIAAIAAPVLRAIIHRIEARKDWTPEQKRWIPWICVGLGGLVVVASALAGLPIDEAVILGGGAPGAVVVNELLGTTKKDDTPTNLNHPGPPAILALLFLSACAPAWQTGAALVSTAHVAVKGYQAYTHDARSTIIAASGCADEAACKSALAPFNAKQAPVLACLDALAPLVDAAALAADAKDAKAAAAVLPSLAAKVPACVVEIEKAKR